MEKNLEIFVIEDSEKHLADAKTYFGHQIELGARIKVSYATTLQEALNAINTQNYDGIISDIFFPSGMNDDREIVKGLASKLMREIGYSQKYAEDITAWERGENLAPLGVYIAEKRGITPFVFCTDTFHHGTKTEPVNHYATRSNNLDIVDCGYGKQEGSQKNFAEAYAIILKKIIENKLGKRPSVHRDNLEKLEAINQHALQYIPDQTGLDSYRGFPTGDKLRKYLGIE